MARREFGAGAAGARPRRPGCGTGERIVPLPYTGTGSIMDWQADEASQLIIYNASAGSGKTYTLVKRLLLHALCHEGWHPSPRGILRRLAGTLCITFTNKAAGELKERLLGTLHAMAQSAEAPMLADLAHTSGLPADEIRTRAALLLTALLHNYSSLSVSTIDSFLQRMAQTLLWELHMHAEVGITLDRQQVLSEATDQLLGELKEETDTYQWLLSLAHTRTAAGKSWVFRKSLMGQAAQLFQPAFQLLPATQRHAFFAIERISGLHQHLTDEMKALQEGLLQLYTPLEVQLRDAGLTAESFAYGQTSHWVALTRVMRQIRDGKTCAGVSKRMRDASLDADRWFSKKQQDSAEGAHLQQLVQESLFTPYVALIEHLDRHLAVYNTCCQAMALLPQMSVLATLRGYITAVSRRRRMLLPDDLTVILRDLAHGDDTTFIFERMGTRYDSVMIDEFQDTSRVHWSLLQPLVENSLAEGGLAMLVGDVKQAIYRWRGGDWLLLADEIPQAFEATFGCERATLTHNYRSAATVVEFNNRFFEAAVAQLSSLCGEFMQGLPPDEALRDAAQRDFEAFIRLQESAFSSLRQIPHRPTSEVGYVELAEPAEATESSPKSEGEESPAMPGALAYTMARIDYLIDELGVPAGDIAVLVRRRSTASTYVDALLAHGQARAKDPYSVVSQDALLVDNSPDVQVLLAAMRVVGGLDSPVDRALLERHLAECMGELDELRARIPLEEERQHLRQAGEWLRQFVTYPLLEAFDGIAQGLCIPSTPGERPYVLALRDIVHAYQRDGSPNLQAFLTSYAEQNPALRALDLAKDKHAVNVITVHKSKGLEFDTVICPEIDWPISPRVDSTVLWGRPFPEGGDEMLLPTQMRSDSLRSSLALTVLQEHWMRHIDSLNLLYVAFTRAKRRLILVRDGKANTGGTYQAFVQPACESYEWSSQQIVHGATVRSIGELVPHDASASSAPSDGNVRRADLTACRRTGDELFTTTKLRIRRAITVARRTAFDQLRIRKQRQQRGELLHEILSGYAGADRLWAALEQLAQRGHLEQAAAECLHASITMTIEHGELRPCFDGQFQHLAEREIISHDGSVFRPDRVSLLPHETLVLDFKFAHPKDEDRLQVQRYLAFLSEMGHPAPRGYLWYLNPDDGQGRLEPVTL